MSIITDALAGASGTYLETYAPASGLTFSKQPTATGTPAGVSPINALIFSTLTPIGARYAFDAGGTTATTRYLINGWTPRTANYRVKVTIYPTTKTGAADVILRGAVGDASSYGVRYATTAGQIQIIKSVAAGSLATVLASVVYAATNGVDFTLEGRVQTVGGNVVLTALVNGSQVLTFTDVAPAAVFLLTGAPGLGFFPGGGTDATAMRFHNLELSDLPDIETTTTTVNQSSVGNAISITGIGNKWLTTPPTWTFLGGTLHMSAPTSDNTVSGTLDATATPGTYTLTDTTTGATLSIVVASTSTFLPGTIAIDGVTATSVSLHASAPTGGAGGNVYSWLRDGVVLAGATSLVLSDTTALPAPHSYSYVQHTRDAAGNTVDTPPVVVFMPSAPTLSAGTLSAGTPGLTSVALALTGTTGGIAPLTMKFYKAAVSGGVRTLVQSGALTTCTATGLTPAVDYFFSADVVDALGTAVTSNELDVRAGSPGIANAVALLFPDSGPFGYAGQPSASFPVSLAPVGGTVPAPVAVTISALTAGGAPAAGTLSAPTLLLSTGTPGRSVVYTPALSEAGTAITIRATPDPTSGLAAPADIVYTVLLDTQRGVPMVAAYGSVAGHRLIGYVVKDMTQQPIIAYTTAGVYEDPNQPGTYSMIVVVSRTALARITMDLNPGQLDGLTLIVEPDVPGPTTMGFHDGQNNADAFFAAMAAGTVGTNGAKFQSFLTGGVGEDGAALLSADARVRLATDALAELRFPLAPAAGHAKDLLELALGAALRVLLNISQQDTETGVVEHLGDDGVTPYLTRGIDTIGTTVVITPS